MGLTDIFKKKQTESPLGIQIDAPLGGKLKPLQSLHDGVFSEELLGKGCVIDANEETIFSCVNGTVAMTTPSRHAIGIMSDEGVELLIHIGLDTVMMNGEGFEYFVEKGERIKKGQPLMRFSKEKIKQAGYVDEVILIVSNSARFQSVEWLEKQEAKVSSPLLNIIK